MTGTSLRSNLAATPQPGVAFVRGILALSLSLALSGPAAAQEVSAFPETPRPIRKVDAAAPISLTDATADASSLFATEQAKTPIRRLADDPDIGSGRTRSAWTMWIVLGGIVGAAAAMSYWARRGGAAIAHWKLPSTVFQVLGRSSVGAQQSVTLLRLGERVVLVSSSGPTMQTLAVITDPAEVAAMTSECLSKRSSQIAEIPQQRSRRPAGRNEPDLRPVAATIGESGLVSREARHA